MIKRHYKAPPNTATELQRLQAIQTYCQNYFTSQSLNIKVLIGSTNLTPPQKFDKSYLYINPERYHSMRVDAQYVEQLEDANYNLWINIDYHSSYSFHMYGKDYNSFDYLKTIRSLLYVANFPSMSMAFMDAETILNLTDTILSDSGIYQRFKMIAHFMQNDIINLGTITSINQVEIDGVFSGVDLKVIAPKVLNT